MALTSLQNQFISASYGQLIQISGSELADGNGSSLSSSILNISASYALTASHALNVPATASYALTASIATSASRADSAAIADQATTASYALASDKSDSIYVEATGSGKLLPVLFAENPEKDEVDPRTSGYFTASIAQGSVKFYYVSAINYLGGLTTVEATTFSGNASTATSASYATTSSYAFNSISASHALTSISASHALTAISASIANTASLALDVDSAANISISAITASSATFTSASIGYLQTVTGSAVIIGDSFIILNNDTPTVRYAGIKVQDSGSANTTASFQFDGGTDDWFFEKEVGGVPEFGVALFGPEYTTLGTPIYPAANQLQKGTGGHHITGSGLYEDGTKVYTDLPVSASAGFTGDLTGLATSASFALTASFVLGGVENATSASYVSGSGATVDALIVNGTENPTFNVDTSTNQFVYINGNEQLGLNVFGSVKMGDVFNDFVGTAYNSLVQGERNTFSDANNAAIIGARESTLSGGATEHSVIAGGHTNTITDANRAFIGGGYTNSVNDTLSAIVGGKNNIINSGHTGSVILGGVNITSSNSDTVYVPDLCVTGNISGSTSVDGSLSNTNCESLTITSNTASLDCTRGNNFLLNINQAANLLLKIEQPQLAQTINLKVTSAEVSPGAINWDPIIKFSGGTPYAWTQITNAEDIITLITFNSTSEMFATALANFS